MKKECPVCGSIYEIKKIKIPVRDKDSLNCEICNHELLSWNGGVMYTSKLIQKKENHLNK